MLKLEEIARIRKKYNIVPEVPTAEKASTYNWKEEGRRPCNTCGKLTIRIPQYCYSCMRNNPPN